MKSPFYNKKIGIWGYGIVGSSAYNFFKPHTKHIEILTQTYPTEEFEATTKISLQNNESIQNFFQNNDYILASPGIPLHNYMQFAHKFITEIDILQTMNIPTIAITGTLGKTTITHVLTQILQQTTRALAAGNIGYPILTINPKQYDIAILELSSFQLQHNKSFAPDLAIWTNFYENHLDYHTSIQEYFEAKCKVLQYQNNNQQALLPLTLAQKIEEKVQPKKNWAFFTTSKPTKTYSNNIYYLENNTIYKKEHQTNTKICRISKFLNITYAENLLIVAAALDMKNIPIQLLDTIATTISRPQHRLEKITTLQETTFFNDSKSTVWQATLQAVQAMDQKPIRLFLGGLSKGTDRSALIKELPDKKITVYSFGKEAEHIQNFCKESHIPCFAFPTLEEAFNQCMKTIQKPSTILFSPGGSSFDLFKNYEDRGSYFINLVNQYKNMLEKK